MDPVDHLIAASGLPAAAPGVIATAWQAMLDAARATWPEVRIDPAQLVEFIAQRLAGPDLAAALATAPAADLVLAAACTAQEPTAHAAFDAVLTEVDAAGASTRSPQDLIDDVKQLLRVQLLVARDGKVQIQDAPGWGVEISKDWLSKASYQKSELS